MRSPWIELLKNLAAFWNQHWPILLIGLTVGLLAFIVGRFLVRASNKAKAKETAKDLDNFDLHAAKERRADMRRQGNPVEVELSDASGKLQNFVGFVVDRSRGGFAVHAPVNIPPGTVLNARPRVRENTYSIPVEVRTCRAEQDGFVLGCQFIQMPPWNVLLLFG